MPRKRNKIFKKEELARFLILVYALGNYLPLSGLILMKKKGQRGTKSLYNPNISIKKDELLHPKQQALSDHSN